MKIFALSIFTAVLCHGAADTGYKKICTQPEASISIVHHNMPYQMASTQIKDKIFTCIIADPTLLSRLPQDFAHQIVKKASDSTAPKDFTTLLFNAHTKHLSTNDLKAGISSVRFAMLLVRNRQSTRWTGSKDTCWVGTPDASCMIGLRNKNTFCKELLRTFEEQDHIKMLIKRGEAAIVPQLKAAALSAQDKAAFDMIIQCNPLKGSEEGASCAESMFDCNVQ